MGEMGCEKHLSLAVARLYGHRKLSALAGNGEGVASKLAQCSIEKNIKTALLALRQMPELKCIAEGWLSILKGDANRAMASFCLAESVLPFQAGIGRGIAYLCLGELQKAKTCFQPMRPLAKHFPSLSKGLDGNHLKYQGLKQLGHYLYHASLEELKEAEKTISPYLKSHKAWICMRIGDHLALHSEKDDLPI